MSTDRTANAWGCDPSEVWHPDEWCFGAHQFSKTPDGRGYPARQLSASEVAERRPCELCYGKSPGTGSKAQTRTRTAPGNAAEEFLRRRGTAGS